jgi:hypothetical protein
LVGYKPQARILDKAKCVPSVDVIVEGSATVIIGGMPAARVGDKTAHGGKIVQGCDTVEIGGATATVKIQQRNKASGSGKPTVPKEKEPSHTTPVKPEDKKPITDAGHTKPWDPFLKYVNDQLGKVPLLHDAAAVSNGFHAGIQSNFNPAATPGTDIAGVHVPTPTGATLPGAALSKFPGNVGLGGKLVSGASNLGSGLSIGEDLRILQSGVDPLSKLPLTVGQREFLVGRIGGNIYAIFGIK